MYDVLIIGGGPAGMTAAIYAARHKLEQVMITPDIGGQAGWALQVENYLGFDVISGYDLVAKFEEHVRNYNVEVVDDAVTSLEKRGTGFVAKLASGKEFEGRTAIIATGRSARDLGVPGEQEYKRRGVAYCATCDAPLFADEDVAVVGGGNAGLTAAIQLSKIAREIYLIDEFPKLLGDIELVHRIQKLENIKVFTRTKVLRISGGKMVEGIHVKDMDTGEDRVIPVTGVFIEVGSAPNTGFLPKDLELTDKKEIEIDCMNRTNIPGLFAAGDATSVPHKQIIIAAGEGPKALLSAYEYLVRS